MAPITNEYGATLNARTVASHRTLWIAIGLLAFVIRVIVAIAKGSLTNPEYYEYAAVARNFLAGGGWTYTHLGLTYYSFAPPLLSWISALSLWATGSIALAMLVQIAAGAAACSIVAWLAWRLFRDVRAGVLAGLIVAVHPGLIFYAAVKAHPLALDSLFFVGGVAGLICLAEKATLVRALALGAFIGLGTLSRSTALVLLPIGIVWTWFAIASIDRRSAVRFAAAMVVAAVMVMLPWTIRDSLVHHRALFLISTTGEDFWDGNNPYATGHSYIDADHAVINALSPAERAELESQPDEIAQSEWFMKKAKEFIRDNPSAFVLLTIKKFYYFWWFSPQTGVLYAPLWLHAYMAYYAAGLLCAVIGVRRLMTADSAARSAALLCGAFLLILSIVQAIHYVEARHRWAVEPLVLAFSGGGASWLLSRFLAPREGPAR